MMRKIIAAAAILAVTSAHAAEELKFGDLNYFLKENQFNVAADISSTYYKESPEGDDTLETRGYLLETRYGYGINDKLNLYLGLDYAFDREVENKTTNTADFTQDGLANPLLAVNYRVMNQNDSYYNFDLGAVARINIEDAETGTSGKDGNFATGRNSLELNARVGRKWNEANEWQLAGGVVYNASGEETVVANAGDTDYDLDPSYDVFLRAAYQYRPVNEFMLSLSAQVTRVGEFDSEEKTTNIESNEESHLDMDFVFRAKYLITDNFIANFHYGMSRNEEYDVETNGTDAEIKRRRENFFGIGVDFLF